MGLDCWLQTRSPPPMRHVAVGVASVSPSLKSNFPTSLIGTHDGSAENSTWPRASAQQTLAATAHVLQVEAPSARGAEPGAPFLGFLPASLKSPAHLLETRPSSLHSSVPGAAACLPAKMISPLRPTRSMHDSSNHPGSLSKTLKRCIFYFLTLCHFLAHRHEYKPPG